MKIIVTKKKCDIMLNKKIIVILFFSFFFLFGCLKSPEQLEEYQYQLVEEKLTLLKNDYCACFVCTESAGGALSDIFVYNDLASGGCYIEPKCTPNFLVTFFENNKYNFMRPFDIGYGSTYYEYEEANLRSSIGLGIVYRELNERELPLSDNYLLPFYGDHKKVKLEYETTSSDISKLGDWKKNPIYRALEKNSIPIYYVNSEHLTTEWLNDFFEKTDISTTPSFIAVKSTANDVNDLVKNLNSKCKDEQVKKDMVIRKCLEKKTETVEDPVTGKSHSVEICKEYQEEELMVYGCKSMLSIDYMVNSSNVKYDGIFEQINSISEENIEELDTFLIHANITEEDACHAGMVTVQAMNLSRTLMREYGTKPSYLIIHVDDYCRKNYENQIAETLISSIYFMRMTGIMGMVYYDYLPDSYNILNDLEKPKTLLQLTNYYYNNSYGYNREPLYFDADGHNISKMCDTMSKRSTLTINVTETSKMDINRLNLDGLSALNKKGEESWWYVYALPVIDYGKWSTLYEDFYDKAGAWFDESWSCDINDMMLYSNAHLEAERCGVSAFMLMAFKNNNVVFNCEEWYDMIDRFVEDGSISIDDVQKQDSSTMRKLAFAYAMDEEKRKIINSNSEMRESCFTEGVIPPANSKPCNVVNDYQFYRDEFLDYTFYPDCYISNIGKISN
jgi:hypothetical protein